LARFGNGYFHIEHILGTSNEQSGCLPTALDWPTHSSIFSGYLLEQAQYQGYQMGARIGAVGDPCAGVVMAMWALHIHGFRAVG